TRPAPRPHPSLRRARPRPAASGHGRQGPAGPPAEQGSSDVRADPDRARRPARPGRGPGFGRRRLPGEAVRAGRAVREGSGAVQTRAGGGRLGADRLGGAGSEGARGRVPRRLAGRARDPRVRTAADVGIPSPGGAFARGAARPDLPRDVRLVHRGHLRLLPAAQTRPRGGAHGSRPRLPAGDVVSRPLEASVVRRARLRIGLGAALVVTLLVLVVGGIAYGVMVSAQNAQGWRELRY